MVDERTRMIEELRTRLLERARSIVERSQAISQFGHDSEATEPAAPSSGSGQQAGPGDAKTQAGKRNYFAKASSKFGQWLKSHVVTQRRFPRSLGLRFDTHLDLYEQLRRFAEKTGEAGDKISSDYISLQSRHKSLAARVEALKATNSHIMESLAVRIREMNCHPLIAVLSKEVADLRKKVSELEKK